LFLLEAKTSTTALRTNNRGWARENIAYSWDQHGSTSDPGQLLRVGGEVDLRSECPQAGADYGKRIPELLSWEYPTTRSNVVATVMTLAMGGKLSKADKAWTAFLDLEKLVDAEEVMRLSPLVFRVGKLDEEQREVIMATKTKLPEPKFFQQLREDGKIEGVAAGERAKALESARKLLEHGVSWDIITDSTGVKPADLKKAAKPASTHKVAKK